jgi:hypothetical protein
LIELVKVVVLVSVVISVSVNCVVNIALFMRSAAGCTRPRGLHFAPKLLEASLVRFNPSLFLYPAVLAIVSVSGVEAAGGVVYGGLIELAVVVVRLHLGAIQVDREVVLRCLRGLRVGLEVDVTVLLIASFEFAQEVFEDGDNLIYRAVLA